MQRLLTIGVLAASLLACGTAAAARSIVLCFERQEVLPWRSLDGGGLDFELLSEVARRLDLEFAYQSMPWKRCLAQLNANQVQGAFSASFVRERMALGVYPGGGEADPAQRLHTDVYVLVRRKGSSIDWDGRNFLNLDGRIGIELGYSVGDFLRARSIPVDEGTQRSAELLDKLLAGRVAGAALLGGAVASHLKRDPTLADRIEVRGPPLVEKPYYLMLSHQFVNTEPALAERIWRTIAQVRNSPAYRKREREFGVFSVQTLRTGHPGR
jgi:polar amino acid transport system substrate-binding protein